MILNGLLELRKCSERGLLHEDFVLKHSQAALVLAQVKGELIPNARVEIRWAANLDQTGVMGLINVALVAHDQGLVLKLLEGRTNVIESLPISIYILVQLESLEVLSFLNEKSLVLFVIADVVNQLWPAQIFKDHGHSWLAVMIGEIKPNELVIDSDYCEAVISGDLHIQGLVLTRFLSILSPGKHSENA